MATSCRPRRCEQTIFDAFFVDRRERLCQLIEKAIGEAVQRDVDEGRPTEASDEFEPDLEEPELLVLVED